MISKVETTTPPGTMTPIGPYSQIAKAGHHIAIDGTVGIDPKIGGLTGPDIDSQTKQILAALEVMLATVGSDLDHVVHINVFIMDMQNFEAVNVAYIEKMGDRRPARTVVAISALPKSGALLTMNLTAITRE